MQPHPGSDPERTILILINRLSDVPMSRLISRRAWDCGRKCALFATASVTPVIPGGFVRRRVGQGAAYGARQAPGWRLLTRWDEMGWIVGQAAAGRAGEPGGENSLTSKLECGLEGGSRPISRVLSWATIHLGRASPRASSGLPGSFASSGCGPRACVLPYLALLRMGFAVPSMLPPTRCALTAPFHPYRHCCGASAVCSLLHFPWARAPQALPGTLLHGARTFLRDKCAAVAWPTPAPSIQARGNAPALSPWRAERERAVVEFLARAAR